MMRAYNRVHPIWTQALADIVARWKAKGWWAQTTGGAAKKAKAIYEELLKASS